MVKLSFERKTLLKRSAESLFVAYEGLIKMEAEAIEDFLSGDVTLAAVSHVTGFEEDDIKRELFRLLRRLVKVSAT